MINVGTGTEHTVKQYAEFIKKNIYKELKISFDGNKKMDGTRKINSLVISKRYGWFANKFKKRI